MLLCATTEWTLKSLFPRSLIISRCRAECTLSVAPAAIEYLPRLTSSTAPSSDSSSPARRTPLRRHPARPHLTRADGMFFLRRSYANPQFSRKFIRDTASLGRPTHIWRTTWRTLALMVNLFHVFAVSVLHSKPSRWSCGLRNDQSHSYIDERLLICTDRGATARLRKG